MNETRKDETLVCDECGKEFIFTAGEQEFYERNGLNHKPKRCKACRDAKKNAYASKNEDRRAA